MKLHKMKMTYYVLETSTLATADVMASVFDRFEPPFDHGSHDVRLGLDGMVPCSRFLFLGGSSGMAIPHCFGDFPRLSKVTFVAGTGVLASA